MSPRAPAPEPEVADLVPEYLERRAGDVATLGRALDVGDFETVRILGHRMAGSGTSYGLPEVAAIGRNLEAAADARDAGAARRARAELERLVAPPHSPAGARRSR